MSASQYSDAGVNAGPDLEPAPPDSDGADDAPNEAKGAADLTAPAPASTPAGAVRAGDSLPARAAVGRVTSEGDTVTIISGAHGGRRGVVVAVGRNFSTGGRVLHVEFDAPALLTQPNGPTKRIRLPYGPHEVEAAPLRCSCGSDAFSLNPAEVVVHRSDGPCYIAPANTGVTQ